jgi:ribosome-associated protein
LAVGGLLVEVLKDSVRDRNLQWDGTTGRERRRTDGVGRTTNDCMKKNHLKQQLSEAINACQEKKAEEITILEMEKGSGAFTDYFVVCSGTNPRQIQAISDEVEERLEKSGLRPTHVEGYKQAEWVLLDYVDFVVHVFSEKARRFYDLERLWKSAKRLTPPELAPRSRRSGATATRGAAKKPA